MKCIECGHALTKSVSDHMYRESGMDHVILRNVAKYDCENCGAARVEIVRMAQLHRLLAEILVRKTTRLVPSEVRYLRDFLDLTNRTFAVLMGVTESQASRWTSATSGEQMSTTAEHLLRMLTTLGPSILTSVEPASLPTKPIADMLRALPPRDAEAIKETMRLRRGAKDWIAETAARP
jgi:DNA-binding transcriptional regulator YiaG